ncbi:MAG: polysaccharide deacetylase family protein [Chitinophagaceae bacterium]|nr:polysaccharide deacetylase family protein [Chitinophagaceae bacterium]
MNWLAPHFHKQNPSSPFRFFRKDRYFIRTPFWFRFIYPYSVWKCNVSRPTVFLTFDDGPHPELTPFVLDELKKYNAKATFFCIGRHVEKHTELFQQIIREGHAVGNHTFHHLNGWKTDTNEYIQDVLEADRFIQSSLFRPPYGRLTLKQLKKIRSGTELLKPMKIIMWSILSGDWDSGISPVTCYKRIATKITSGDIIVFHDSEKARENLVYTLPRILKNLHNQGFAFDKIA